MKAYLVRVCAGLNVLLLLMAAILFYGNGATFSDGRDLAVAFLMVITPAFTVFTLLAPDDRAR